MKTHYDQWHQNTYHKHVHWGIFLLYVGLLTGSVFGYVVGPEATSAASNISIQEVSTGDGGMVSDSKHTISTNKDSAIANGNDSITVTVGSFRLADYMTGEPIAPTPWCFEIGDYRANQKIVASGTGNTIEPSTSQINCDTGLATFTLKSTSAGTKTISVYQEGKGIDPWWNTDAKVTINFTTPATSSTSSVTTTTTKTVVPKNTQASQAATETTTPSNPTITNEKPLVIEKVNETSFSTNKDENVFEETKSLKLAGKTFPNAKVTLYIYSEPFIAQTTSDANGYWEYEVTKALEPGGHKVEAEVTKEDGTTVPKAEIATFRVAAATTTTRPSGETAVSKAKKVNYPLLVGIAAGVILISAMTTAIILKKKHKKD